MHKDGIVVAEYWTDLPPKQELRPDCGSCSATHGSGWLDGGYPGRRTTNDSVR